MDKLSTITDKFIRRLNEIRSLQLDKSLLKQAKLCLLDYIGVSLAGSKMLISQHTAYLERLLYTCGKSTVIGVSNKADIYTAALLNGLSAHETELDDGHRLGMIHLASPIISALLPIAEARRVSYEDLLIGIISGYEAAVRLARAVQPYHKLKGYHTTGTCGTIGAAIGVSAMLNYSETQTKAALSMAITSSAGVLEIQEDGSQLKPYNAGQAALNGLTAAMMGQLNLLSPNDILGGNRGFLMLYGEDANKETLIADYENGYEIERIYMKPYASCRHSHPSIEAVVETLKDNNINYNEVNAIQINTYQAAVEGHDHKDIQGSNSAKMSIPYSVAVAIVAGRVGLNEFSRDWIYNTDVKRIMNKIDILVDSDLTAAAPEKRAAIAKIITKDGLTYSKKIDYPKGEPENPMSIDDLKSKFIGLAKHSGVCENRAYDIITTILGDGLAFLQLLQDL
jgi:2-methylcitrate dehydratase PrpD